METLQTRLSKALNMRGIKASELARVTGIDKARISQYTNGVYVAKQQAIYSMAKALDVNEAWLLGYDVPMERKEPTEEISKLSDGEAFLLDLFRNIPTEQQESVLNSIKFALERTE